MAKNHSVSDVLAIAAEAVIIGMIVYLILKAIPSIYAGIATTNTRIAQQTSPGAAADSVWARLITSSGDVGVGLIDRWGESLLNTGGQ